MYIWTVSSYLKDGQLDDVSEPFISADFAMRDWQFNHLDWTHVVNTKFSGTEMDHWQAEDDYYDYVLEAQYVVGS